MKEDMQSLHESERNARAEERMLEILHRDGAGAKKVASSTAGSTRTISEVSGSNEQGPSKKR
ncbi:MAG: hypothetical protein EOP34_05365 [Rickettsiales bacterium]|nr:MAG: hypothetical protein EOP34_05365 [Rickettsiales bacterium]